MEKTFDPDKFIRRIGKRLIEEFEDAKSGTTPSTVGSAAEQPVRDQLEQILPRGIAVGEGFVIDSYGATSRQQDVILYERDICPKFSVNDTPETTYYPCEGVIAVGEIKSSLDGKELEDSLRKIESVKKLERHNVSRFMPHPTTGRAVPSRRNYLTPSGDSIIDVNEGIEQEEKAQIFGFILAGESKLRLETLIEKFYSLSVGMDWSLRPNVLVTLDGYFVRWGKIAKAERKEIMKSDNGTFGVKVYKDGPEGWHHLLSAKNATHAGGAKYSDPFRMLVLWLKHVAVVGRTSDVTAFDRYFEEKDSQPVPLVTVTLKA